MKARTVFEWLLRLGLGGVFIYAGVMKLRDLEQFFLDVHHFDLTPWNVSMGLAMFLPWLEIAAGAALIGRRLYHGAIALCGGMSAVFLVAIASAWMRGLDLTCGCFGKETNATNYPQHLALNGAMLAAVVWLVWLEYRSTSAS
jgi:uncharacterized membrane protein YphA (DoxX/SURF4 family)